MRLGGAAERGEDLREDAAFFDAVTAVREALHGPQPRRRPEPQGGGRAMTLTGRRHRDATPRGPSVRPQPSAPGHRRGPRCGWSSRRALLVLGLLVEFLVAPSSIPPFVLAEPVGDRRAVRRSTRRRARRRRSSPALNALIGLIIGSVLGVLLAVLASFCERASTACSRPIVAAVAVVPIVALAPVLYTMFGSHVRGRPRILIAALAVFVPVFLNTLRGLPPGAARCTAT